MEQVSDGDGDVLTAAGVEDVSVGAGRSRV